MTTTVTASAYNSGDTAVELEPLKYLLAPSSGNRDMIERTSWATKVRTLRDAGEQRHQSRARPQRTLNVACAGINRADTLSIHQWASRAGLRRFLLPLWSDEIPVTAGATATSTSLTCATTGYRFYQGGRVAVFTRTENAGAVDSFEVVTVSVVSGSALTVSALTATYTDAYVVPLVECELLPESGIDYQHLWMGQLQVSANEVVGVSAIPPAATVGSTPSGYTDYNSIPILDLDAHRTKSNAVSYLREGSIVDTGLTTLPNVYGPRAKYRADVGLEFYSRASWWSFMQFFDSRAGRTYPFWCLQPSMDYTVEAVTTTTVDVTAVGEESDWDLRPYIGIRKTDGTVYIRGVDSVSRSSGTDTVTFDTSIPSISSLSDIDRVAPAMLARFDSDELETNHRSANLIRSQTRIIELVNEQSASLSLSIDAVTDSEAFDPGCGDPPAPSSCPCASWPGLAPWGETCNGLSDTYTIESGTWCKVTVWTDSNCDTVDYWDRYELNEDCTVTASAGSCNWNEVENDAEYGLTTSYSAPYTGNVGTDGLSGFGVTLNGIYDGWQAAFTFPWNLGKLTGATPVGSYSVPPATFQCDESSLGPGVWITIEGAGSVREGS